MIVPSRCRPPRSQIVGCRAGSWRSVQRALGTSVMGGMIGVVILALLMVLVFFVSVQLVLAKDREKVEEAEVHRTSPEPAKP